MSSFSHPGGPLSLRAPQEARPPLVLLDLSKVVVILCSIKMTIGAPSKAVSQVLSQAASQVLSQAASQVLSQAVSQVLSQAVIQALSQVVFLTRGLKRAHARRPLAPPVPHTHQ